jgi:large subunit ribosomal protein L25
MHLDFINISLDEKINAEVGIDFVGEPEGLKDGGIVETVRGSVMVSALPMEIPSSVEVDIAALEVGDTLTVADLPVIEGVEYLDEEEAAIVTVIIPRIVEAAVEEVELDEDGMPIVVEGAAEGEEGAEEAGDESAGDEDEG